MEFERISSKRSRLYRKGGGAICSQRTQSTYRTPQANYKKQDENAGLHPGSQQTKTAKGEGFSLSKILGEDSDYQDRSNIKKILNYNPPTHHRRNSSHRRQQSVFFDPDVPYEQVLTNLQTLLDQEPGEQNYLQETIRNKQAFADISNICLQNIYKEEPISLLEDDKIATTCATQPKGPQDNFGKSELFKEKNNFDFEANIRSSLPMWGAMPRSAYCPVCRQEVHTVLDFKQDSNVPSSLLKAISQVFQCCQLPVWLKQYRIHKCANCGKILAKS